MGLAMFRRHYENLAKESPKETPKKPKKAKEGAKNDGKPVK